MKGREIIQKLNKLIGKTYDYNDKRKVCRRLKWNYLRSSQYDKFLKSAKKVGKKYGVAVEGKSPSRQPYSYIAVKIPYEMFE